MSAPAIAVALTYDHAADAAYHTPFVEADDCPDPLGMARLFVASEEPRGDFPGALWTATGDERARKIAAAARTARLLGEDVDEAIATARAEA